MQMEKLETLKFNFNIMVNNKVANKINKAAAVNNIIKETAKC